MSGFCSAHIGHDPNCSTCASSSPEEAARSKAYEEAFTNGFRRGAEAVAEWLEGAQWDEQGQPAKRDPLGVEELSVFDDEAKMLAGLIRKRFISGEARFSATEIRLWLPSG
jgi:hypothetical protein